MTRTSHAVPAGYYRDERLILNPPPDLVLREEDKILVFSEESGLAKLEAAKQPLVDHIPTGADYTEKQTGVVIFGYNETLPTVLRELPEHVNKVSLVGQKLDKNKIDRLTKISENRQFQLNIYPDEPETDEELSGIAGYTEHIILLSRHDEDPEQADMEVICLLLRLRDIRERENLRFNITVEMQKEHNQSLVHGEDNTDFLVSSSMSSLILAQLAESPQLISAFREILSNKGNELYLKNAEDIRMTGSWTVRDLRRIILQKGYIMLGYLDTEYVSHFNPPLDDEIRLGKDDWIIVLGEN